MQYITSLLSSTPPPPATTSPLKVRVEYSCGSVEYTTACSTGTYDPDQLTTRIDRPRVRPLVVTPVPLLRASFHLSCVIGSQRQTLQTTTSGHRPRGNEVVQGQTIEGTEHTPWTLDSLVDHFSRRIGPVQIITGGPNILDIVPCLELFETFRPSIVDVLGVRDELRRRRSVGSGHFEWRTG